MKPLKPPMPDDGTRQLLQGGGAIVGAGIVAGVLLEAVLGGVSRTGAHTNAGWFALIVLLGCIPFGGMLLTLGVAKWLRNRSLFGAKSRLCEPPPDEAAEKWRRSSDRR